MAQEKSGSLERPKGIVVGVAIGLSGHFPASSQYARGILYSRPFMFVRKLNHRNDDGVHDSSPATGRYLRLLFAFVEKLSHFLRGTKVGGVKSLSNAIVIRYFSG